MSLRDSGVAGWVKFSTKSETEPNAFSSQQDEVPPFSPNLEMNFCLFQAALEVCRTFLQKDEGEGVIMVTDPPFGGLVEPLAVTFKKLIAMWKEGQSQGV